MTHSSVLVEGPKWADAIFYGKWLLAAAKANALWNEAINDPDFSKQVERLTLIYIPDFSICATVLLSRLEKNLASFVVSVNGDEEAEEFAMMIGMGFFVPTGQRYQMVVPTLLTLKRVKKAALALIKTEDEENILHPECIITTMPCEDAKIWQSRLRHMNEDCRLADRQLLLDIYPDSPSGVTRRTLPATRMPDESK
jgi:hypothetical protein